MNLSDYKEEKPHRAKRMLWHVVNATVFRMFFGNSRYPNRIRQLILIAFGAKVTRHTLIYNSCNIYMPWNLQADRVCIGPNTEIYNKSMVTIGNDSVVSQGSFLCTAGHDTSSIVLPMITAPITIKEKAWVAADAFVGMGVTIGEGAVVGARAAVFKSVEPWTVVGGNPAKFIKKREIKDE